MAGGDWKQSKVVAGIAILVALGAFYFLIRGQGGSPARTPESDAIDQLNMGVLVFYVCEDCKDESVGSMRPTPYKCEKCGKEAVVQSVRFKCGSCGKEFEGWRSRTIMSPDGKRPVGFETKRGDGPWQRLTKMVPKCPGCGAEGNDKVRLLFPNAGAAFPAPAPPSQ